MNKRMTMEPEALRRYTIRDFWREHRGYAYFAIGFAGGAGACFVMMAIFILWVISDGGL